VHGVFIFPGEARLVSVEGSFDSKRATPLNVFVTMGDYVCSASASISSRGNASSTHLISSSDNVQARILNQSGDGSIPLPDQLTFHVQYAGDATFQ